MNSARLCRSASVLGLFQGSGLDAGLARGFEGDDLDFAFARVGNLVDALDGMIGNPGAPDALELALDALLAGVVHQLVGREDEIADLDQPQQVRRGHLPRAYLVELVLAGEGDLVICLVAMLARHVAGSGTGCPWA